MIRFFLTLLLFMHSLAGAEPKKLKVGMELAYPPFETICESGAPCGISVDLANALGKFLNRTVTIQNIAFVGLVPALKSGKIDLIISSMTNTPERCRTVNFSEPYASTGLCLLINKKSPMQDILDADVPGRVIIVKSGTSGEIYARKNFKYATVRILDKEAMCILEVIQGKADAFIYDQISVYTNWKKNPDTTRAALKPFQIEKWAIAIRKTNPELLEQVNQFLTLFREQGGFEELSDKYLPEQKAAFRKLGIPFII